jgi:hypothetical protein
MKKFFLLIILVLTLTSVVAAETSPESVVALFGKEMSEWCKTGDISHRENIEALCDGVKKCRVEDKIHADYQSTKGLTGYETFVLDSYLNMFQTFMSDKISFSISNIQIEEQDEMSEGQKLSFITANIKLSGIVNQEVKDLFLVRDNKISGIYTYSSQLSFNHLHGSLLKALKLGKYHFSYFGFENGYVKIVNDDYSEGLMDTKGNIIIPCMWSEVFYYGGEFAVGSNGEELMRAYDLRYGGRMIPESKINHFADGQGSCKFSEGYMRFPSQDEKWGFLSASDSEYNISYDYDFVTDFVDGYSFVIQDEVEYIIDKNFRTILSSNDKYRICGNAREGLVCVENSETGKYGFVDLKGHNIVPCIYDRVRDFSDGLCVVYKDLKPGYLSENNTFGYIDTKGRKVIPEIFNDCTSQYSLTLLVDGGPREEHDFINGYAIAYIVKNDKPYGTMIGKNGKPLTGFDFENQRIHRFSCGLAAFENHMNKWGFYNSKGETIVPAKYDFISDFKEDIAVVGKIINGEILHGCINTDGVEIVPLIYDSILDFENGVALATLNGEVGLIDRYGNNSFKQK